MHFDEYKKGNIVNTKGGIRKIDAIGIENKTPIYYCYSWLGPTNLFPICITEGWLIKLGMDNKLSSLSGDFSYNFPNSSNTISYIKSQNKFIISYPSLSGQGEDVEVEVKSVHHIQNFYFFWTHSDLIVNL